jgi:hypothetical protein
VYLQLWVAYDGVIGNGWQSAHVAPTATSRSVHYGDWAFVRPSPEFPVFLIGLRNGVGHEFGAAMKAD